MTRAGPEAIFLTNHFAVFEDASAALTLADVTRPEFAERFTTDARSGQALGFSYTRSAVWLRLHLQNPSDQPVERVLEIAYALDMAHRVCGALQALGLPHDQSVFACVTASVGVASVYPAEGSTPDELLRAADSALYTAKAQGRNRAILAGA